MVKGKVDIFKDGKGEDKIVWVSVKGENIGNIHMHQGSDVTGSPDRVIININPKQLGVQYEVHEAKIVVEDGFSIFIEVRRAKKKR